MKKCEFIEWVRDIFDDEDDIKFIFPKGDYFISSEPCIGLCHKLPDGHSEENLILAYETN